MNRFAYVVGHFKGGFLVDLGIYSEPFPTIADLSSDSTRVLASITDADYERAHRRAKRVFQMLRAMMHAAPARAS